jgi:hypothetical protein
VISETPKRGRQRRERETAKTWIQLRVTMSRKNAYVRAAKPKNLTKWIFKVLDKASDYEPPKHD